MKIVLNWCANIFLRIYTSFKCPDSTAAKIADSLGVTIDYQVKEGEYQNIDDETLKRMKNIEKLSKEDKSHVFAMLDALFAKSKLQSLLA